MTVTGSLVELRMANVMATPPGQALVGPGGMMCGNEGMIVAQVYTKQEAQKK